MADKHTPGPWEFDRYNDKDEPACGDDSHYHRIDGPTPTGLTPDWPYTVADTTNRHHCISLEEDAANARLIAAAPELLNALRWSVNHDGECLGDHPMLLDAARTLLAKVEGI